MPSIGNHPRTSRCRAARLRPLHPHGGTRGARPGQALVELAFVLPVILLLVFSIIDFGVLFENRIALDNAARSGARYATVHPTAWSNASSAPANSIEGRVERDGGTVTIPTSAISVTYSILNSNTGVVTPCGYYDAGTGSFQGQNGYTQSTCILTASTAVSSTLVQVGVSNTYNMITPVVRALFRKGITESTSATMMVEASS